jgi:hypothetical protein
MAAETRFMVYIIIPQTPHCTKYTTDPAVFVWWRPSYPAAAATGSDPPCGLYIYIFIMRAGPKPSSKSKPSYPVRAKWNTFISGAVFFFFRNVPNILQCRNQKSDVSAQPSTSCLALLQIFLGRKVYISCHNCDFFFLAGGGCAMLTRFPNFKHNLNLICRIWILHIG